MSTVSGGYADTEADRTGHRGAKAVEGGGDKLGADVFDWKIIWVPFVAMFAFYSMIRVYEQIYGFSAGLNSFSDEFKTYWMTILWVELPVLGAAFVGVMAYLWKTRDRNHSERNSSRRVQAVFRPDGLAHRLFHRVYWGASFFTEQDGTWHQTVVRDTDFTPSHILEFYLSYPIYIVMGCRRLHVCEDTHPVLCERILRPVPDLRCWAVHDLPECRPERMGSYLLVHGRNLRGSLALGLRILRMVRPRRFRRVAADPRPRSRVCIASGLEAKCTFNEEASPLRCRERFAIVR